MSVNTRIPFLVTATSTVAKVSTNVSLALLLQSVLS
jgi:hypothetical protein